MSKPRDPTYGIPSPSNNRFGGYIANPKPLRGATFGPASDTKIYTAAEKAAFMRKRNGE
jgi:hypothetical protein